MIHESPIFPELNETKKTQSNSRLSRLRIIIGTVIALAIVATTVFIATRAPKWEYKTIAIYSEGHSRTGDESGSYATVTPSEAALNDLGKDGWQLASSYLEMETAWTNFGRENYVVGLQPNIRPQRAVLIFKRERSLF